MGEAEMLVASPVPVLSTALEPWSEQRTIWCRWLAHHRPQWSVSAIARTAWHARIVEQFKPKPFQYPTQGCFYSFRYVHQHRLFIVSYADTRIFERLILEQVVQSERDLRYLGYPEHQWFKYYETPELTLDRHRAYLSGGSVREYCFDMKGEGWANPGLYYENAGVNPRFVYTDPETGERIKPFCGGAGVEYFISPTGNNTTGTGTQGNPWQTISRALTTAGGGDIITMLAGTYSDRLFPTSLKNGTALARTTLRPFAGATVVLTHTNTMIKFDAAAHQFWEVGRTGTRIDCNATGMTESLGSVARVSFSSNGTQSGTFVNNIRLRNLLLRNNPRGSGLDVTVFSADTEVFDCTSSANGASNAGHGMYVYGTRMVFEGVSITQAKKFGLHANTEAASQGADTVVRRSRFYENGVAQTTTEFGGQSPSMANIVIDHFTRFLLHNCLAYRTLNPGEAVERYGISVQFSSTPAIYFCDAVFNTTPNVLGIGIELNGPSSTTLRNNIMFGNNTNYRNNGSGTIESNNSRTGTNPQFVNATTNDFHLTASTPVSILNAGVAVAGLTTDYDAVTRGNPPEIGAYELGGGAPPDTTPPAAPTGVFVS
jgi:hypothetical protein